MITIFQSRYPGQFGTCVQNSAHSFVLFVTHSLVQHTPLVLHASTSSTHTHPSITRPLLHRTTTRSSRIHWFIEHLMVQHTPTRRPLLHRTSTDSSSTGSSRIYWFNTRPPVHHASTASSSTTGSSHIHWNIRKRMQSPPSRSEQFQDFGRLGHRKKERRNNVLHHEAVASGSPDTPGNPSSPAG